MKPHHARCAIVTGASKGIGAAIAQRLAQDGINIVVNYAQSQAAAAAVVAAIEAKGGQAIAVRADIADPDGVAELFEVAEKTFGSVDILVNNAGIMELSPIADTSDAAYERQIAINLGGIFRGLREGARRLNAGGRIISFSSSVVGLYQPGYGVYAASKAATEAMTHILAKEVASRQITVNAVAPGPIETALFLANKPEPLLAAIKNMIPAGRFGQVDEVANLVGFLAGADSAWVSGQVIRVNGGQI